MKKELTDAEKARKLIKDPVARVKTARESHYWFCNIYMPDYIQYEMAPFHHRMFQISEDNDAKLAVILSFRGSGKSTIMTTSYPIYAVLGKLQKKFVMIISQTQDQAKLHFRNLRHELEMNGLLRQDLGPFQDQDEWNSCSLIIPKYNAKIVAVSREQAIRGARFGRYRPDLIIADDVEDASTVKTVESRKNTYDWFTSEVLPVGDTETKFVLVGNLLHQDSLLMNIKRQIEQKKRAGVCLTVPIIDDANHIAWPGKFKTIEAIKREERKVGDRIAWFREYLLKIIDDSEPVVDPAWIKYYDQLPSPLYCQPVEYAIGVDLAISQKDTADFTALVSAKIYGKGKDKKIYILPNPINKRMSINDTQDTIKNLVNSYGGRFSAAIYVEDVMLQNMLSQLLVKDHYRAEGLKIGSMDKRARLHIASSLIQSGEIYFPRMGSRELLNQILNFGTTSHDDICDAFTVLILKLIEKHNKPPKVATIVRGSSMWAPKMQKPWDSWD